MRCYNKNCELWNGVMCKTPCDKRMAAKQTAIAHNSWVENNYTAIKKIGNSHAVFIPSRIMAKYNLKIGDFFKIIESDNEVCLLWGNKVGNEKK